MITNTGKVNLRIDEKTKTFAKETEQLIKKSDPIYKKFFFKFYNS